MNDVRPFEPGVGEEGEVVAEEEEEAEPFLDAGVVGECGCSC